MNISLDKKTGINLKKGNSISLEKEGIKLHEICIGLNWGIIEKKSFFGLLKENLAVDLDGSVSTFDSNGAMLETVYYRNLTSANNAIIHSGDDRSGDKNGDDGYDNEVIQISLDKVSAEVNQIVFYLTSYQRQDFGSIPFVKIRIFEGNNKKVKSVFATFNLAQDSSFAGSVAMVMGKMMRVNNNWEFKAIGEAVESRDVKSTISLIQGRYL